MNKEELAAMRRSYVQSVLDEGSVHPDPIEQFRTWFMEASNAGISEPNAMTLATVDDRGQPTARVVLLKEIRAEGLVFYTNHESRKGREIAANPRVCLNFSWLELERQVRVEGLARQLSENEARLYFQSRPKESQIGAWVSRQSEPIPSRVILEKRYREIEEKYAGETCLPLPPYWGGYLVLPETMEFWQGRESRLHDRVLYETRDGSWVRSRLSP